MEEQQHTHFLTTDAPLVGSPFATWSGEQETLRSSRANGVTAALQQPAPSSLTTPTSPTTSWMPLDELATTWAEFGSETASSLALTATGTAFIALSWEASALHHHTWACQEYAQCRTHNATRWYGQAMEDLTEASRKSEPGGAVAGKACERRAAVQSLHPGTGSRLDRPGDGAATASVAPRPGGAAASAGCGRRQRGTCSPTSRQDATHATSR